MQLHFVLSGPYSSILSCFRDAYIWGKVKLSPLVGFHSPTGCTLLEAEFIVNLYIRTYMTLRASMCTGPGELRFYFGLWYVVNLVDTKSPDGQIIHSATGTGNFHQASLGALLLATLVSLPPPLS